LVSTAGSTYRKAGARMLIEADGRITGLLSGGCFENDLREHAQRVLTQDQSRAIEYDMRGEDDWVFGLGAGCEGAMRILLEPLAPDGRLAASLRVAVEMSHCGRMLALAAVHAGPNPTLGTRIWPLDFAESSSDLAAMGLACDRAIGEGKSTAFACGPPDAVQEAWIEVLKPPPNILICGAGPDVEPLVTALRALKFSVTVVDHRAGYADPARFPGAWVSLGPAAALDKTADLHAYLAAIVMSHHLPSDSAYLKALALSNIEYIGVLGPRPRREKLLEGLGALATDIAHRLRGPVGLNIGAVTPEGIALAITAQVHEFAARMANN
jgi:xanthine dehydrogenase accessory factor